MAGCSGRSTSEGCARRVRSAHGRSRHVECGRERAGPARREFWGSRRALYRDRAGTRASCWLQLRGRRVSHRPAKPGSGRGRRTHGLPVALRRLPARAGYRRTWRHQISRITRRQCGVWAGGRANRERRDGRQPARRTQRDHHASVTRSVCPGRGSSPAPASHDGQPRGDAHPIAGVERGDRDRADRHRHIQYGDRHRGVLLRPAIRGMFPCRLSAAAHRADDASCLSSMGISVDHGHSRAWRHGLSCRQLHH